MTTLLDVKTEVYEHIGRNDATVEPMIRRGVNAGLITVAILFEPTESRTSGSLNALSTQNYVSLTTLTRYLRIEHIYNSTGSCQMWPLGFHQLRVFPLPTTGNTKFYALYGDILHYRPQPTGTEVLTVNYLQYPARVLDDGTTLPFAMYEDFVIAMATAYTWACLEEGESEQIWERVASVMNIPFNALSRMRTILRKEIPRVDELQKLVSEGASAAG